MSGLCWPHSRHPTWRYSFTIEMFDVKSADKQSKWVRALTLALAVVSLLAGCRPSDQKPATMRSQIMDGDTITFTKAGYSLCGGNPRPPSSIYSPSLTAKMEAGAERQRLILGQQKTILRPGRKNCFRIGDTVGLGLTDNSPSPQGQARVDRLALGLADKIRLAVFNDPFLASGKSASADGLSYLFSIKNLLYPDQEGIVTAITLTYLPGSASDEALLRQLALAASQGDGLIETSAEGETLPGVGCKDGESWTDFTFPQDFKPALNQGLKSWYRLGRKNCARQGQEIDLTTDHRKGALVAHVRVKKVRTFRVSALDAKYFQLPAGFDFKAISDRIASENQASNSGPQDYLSVIDFDILSISGASDTSTPPAPAPPSTPPKPQPSRLPPAPVSPREIELPPAKTGPVPGPTASLTLGGQP